MNRYLWRALVTLACAVALPASGVCQQPGGRIAPEPRGDRPVASRRSTEMLAQLSDSLQQLAGNVSPAVVQIEVTGYGPGPDNDDRRETATIGRHHAIGAGIIVDPDGYIMTNAHVVQGARRIRVLRALPPKAAADGSLAPRFQVLDANIVGSERQSDLVLLKVDARNLPVLRFNLDRLPQPGELVFAIGSPNGLQNSVTMGVISSAWRQPDPDNPMVYLQTDAPINAGNSGGPLVDVAGAVVGLNTFILSSSGGSDGLGFAVPARIVDFVYQSLRKYGHVAHADIGVVAQTITPAIAEGLGLTQDWGVVIADVIPQGPADLAGLKPADIVLAVDGQPMLGLPGFTFALYQHPRNQVVTIDAMRGTQKLSFTVPAVLARDPLDELADVPDLVKDHIERLGILGLDLDDTLRSLLPEIRGATGVLVVGRARGFDSVDARLRPGDVIHSLNRTPIESVAQLKSAVGQLKRRDAVVLRIERAGRFQFLAFEME
jgi:serine protease Do